jgi:hypothetical protein
VQREAKLVTGAFYTDYYTDGLESVDQVAQIRASRALHKEDGYTMMRAFAAGFMVLAVLVLVVVAFLAGVWAYPRLPASLTAGVSPTEKTESTGKAAANGKTVPGENSPTTTASGYTIAPRCALWSVEGLDLYYSPADPATICAQPPGSRVQAGSRATPGTTKLSDNCATAPDGTVYCRVEGQLSADTLEAFYNRGELQTPREPQ